MRYLIMVLVLAILLVSTAALAADYVVIVNKSNPATVASQGDVKNYYLGKKTSWSDGSPIIVFTQDSSDVHVGFMKQMVRKSPQQYATYWKKSLFTGTGLPPKDFASDDDMKQAVAAQPGAIGYISASALDDSVKKLDIK